MIRVYQKIGLIEMATAVVITPIFRDGEILFRLTEVEFPMMGEFVLN